MSYNYGPTVLYPPAFSMGEPFGGSTSSYEAKENYAAATFSMPLPGKVCPAQASAGHRDGVGRLFTYVFGL